MSHNIQENDIQIGTSQAWHGLTQVREKIDISTVEIRYPMETRPLFCEIDGNRIETGFKQIVALDKNVAIGNPVGSKYSLISNAQVLDMVMEAIGNVDCEIVSVGTVAARSLGFVSLKLKDSDVRMARRETVNVLNVLWGHGGSMPVIAKTTNTVTVCNNTFDVNMSTKSAFTLKLKHCLNAVDKLTNFSEAIDAHYGAVAEFKLAMDKLAERPCNDERATRIVAGILGEGDTLATRTANNVTRVVDLFRGGAGNAGKDIADLFNGFTDFYTHESRGGQDQWKQHVSSEFGAASRAKRDVFSILSDATATRKVEAKGKVLLATLAN